MDMNSKLDMESTKESDTAQKAKQGLPGRLNVILHGLFAFDQERRIIAYIPDMGSQHQYKAGNWLAETTLEDQADLTLEGVDPGQPRLNKILPDHNLILGDVPVSPMANDCDCVRAILRLPYPTTPIRSLRRLRIPAGALGGDDKPKIVDGKAAVESATVQVLTYEFKDDTALKLGEHPWEPVLQWDDKDKVNYVNLHVFSEPDQNVTDDHVRHAFQANISLFVGVDLTLKGRVQPPYSEDGAPPPGVNELELQDLIQRQKWLAVLGRAIKEGRDVNTTWEDLTPFAGSEACTGCAASDS
jgi:hypothetical protein